MNIEEAAKAAKNGAKAAIVVAVFSLVFVAINLINGTQNELVDYYSFIDIGIIFVCAYGVSRKSRTAAIILFLYYLMAEIVIFINTESILNLLISIIFFYFFLKAIQGTIVYHRLKKQEDSDYKSAPRWYYYVGIPLGFIVIAMMGLGLMIMTGALPSIEVLPGSKIPENQIEKLLSEDIISEDDQVIYFYSAGFTSIMEDGNLLTEQLVISYYTDENNELIVYKIPISNISSIELIEKGDFLNDSIYQVNSYDETWLKLFLSTELQGDQRFIEELNKSISKIQ